MFLVTLLLFRLNVGTFRREVADLRRALEYSIG
jgi:hypothetical protein